MAEEALLMLAPEGVGLCARGGGKVKDGECRRGEPSRLLKKSASEAAFRNFRCFRGKHTSDGY